MYTDDFIARGSDELTLTRGDRVELVERDDDFGDGWYLGKHLTNGATGLFPEGISPPFSSSTLRLVTNKGLYSSLYQDSATGSAGCYAGGGGDP